MSQYRADIDGLRAVSVLAVLAYHAKVTYIPGGFVGVDIFFVISGFLITGLLIEEHQQDGRINLVNFWARRVKRLAPALLFVLFSVILLSVFLLERVTGEIGTLARTAIATLLLNSNHLLLMNSADYFSAATEHNPLLHMWSLSVEEQYYVVWPVMLSFLGINSKFRYYFLIIGLFLASFLASLHWSSSDTATAFYLMPSRAWELLVGAFAALVMSKNVSFGNAVQRNIGSTIGVLLIAWSFACINANKHFPAPIALIPVLGAVLLLLACGKPESGPVSRVLGSKPFVYIGRISYPLYLWHWPILVIMRSRRLYEEDLLLDMLGLSIALILSVFTYEVIEKKSWEKFKGASQLKILGNGIFGMGVVLVCATLVGLWSRSGVGYSEKEKLLKASRLDVSSSGCIFTTGPSKVDIERCYPASKKASVLLWGDSHADHWTPALLEVTSKAHLGAGVLTKPSCRPLPPPVGAEDCRAMNEYVLQNLKAWKKSRKLTGIVISARWDEGFGKDSLSLTDRGNFKPGQFYDSRASSENDALNKFRVSLDKLAKQTQSEGVMVLIILSSPVQRYFSQHCLLIKPANECYVELSATQEFSSATEKIILDVAKSNNNVHVIDPKSFMCDEFRCPVMLNGMIAYSDDDHVTAAFAKASANQFTQELSWLMNDKAHE